MESLSQSVNVPSPAGDAGSEPGVVSSPTPQKPTKTVLRDARGYILPGSAPLNPGGRPKTRLFKDAIRKRLMERPDEFEQIIDTIFDKALGCHVNRHGEITGALEAIEFVRDTIGEKPTQDVTLTGGEGEDGEVLEIPIKLIPPANHSL